MTASLDTEFVIHGRDGKIQLVSTAVSDCLSICKYNLYIYIETDQPRLGRNGCPLPLSYPRRFSLLFFFHRVALVCGGV